MNYSRFTIDKEFGENNNDINVVFRFIYFTASNSLITYPESRSNEVCVRYDLVVFGQTYMDDRNTWKQVRRDFKDAALSKNAKLIQDIFKEEFVALSMLYLARQAKLVKKLRFDLMNLVLQRLTETNMIYNHKKLAPDDRLEGHIRKYYDTIVMSAANHQVYYNPMSPFFEDDGKGGFKEEPHKTEDFEHARIHMVPSIVGAVFAASHFVLKNTVFLHSALVGMLRRHGFDPDGVRKWVAYLDHKRCALAKLDRNVHDSLLTVIDENGKEKEGMSH